MNQHYIRKRKPINFTMAELDSMTEEDKEEDYKSSAKPDRKRSPSKRQKES